MGFVEENESPAVVTLFDDWRSPRDISVHTYASCEKHVVTNSVSQNNSTEIGKRLLLSTVGLSSA